MCTRFNVIQIGLGPMGKLIAHLLISRNNINLLGVVDIDPKFEGKFLSDILETKADQKIQVKNSYNSIDKKDPIDVAVVATSSSLTTVTPTIEEIIRDGVNVISICEELSYPYVRFPDLSRKLDNLAKENQCSIIGTGINPGYLMDLLPIVLTAPCQQVNKIKITRMMNSSRRREPFQRKIGTGLSISNFQNKISTKEITGHVGLTESIQMIIGALGLPFGEIKEYPPEPVYAKKEFFTTYGVKVHKGDVCGLKSSAIQKNVETGRNFIIMDFIAYAGDHEEYDSIDIEGVPNISQKIVGGVHGDLGTAAMVANLVPHAYYCNPGLYTMKDIPVPCNTSNVMKK